MFRFRSKVAPSSIKGTDRTTESSSLRDRLQDAQISDAKVVANTHAFLTSNLMRPSLWQTDFVKSMSTEIMDKYARAAVRNNPVETTLPRVMSRLKDPSSSGWLGKEVERHTKERLGDWERRKTLFGNTGRNRTRRGMFSELGWKWSHDGDTPGPWAKGVIGMKEPMENGKLVPRDSRFGNLGFKGSSIFKARKYAKNFNYDSYNWDALWDDDLKGMRVFADRQQVNYGAGTSGSVLEETLAGTLLATQTIQQRAGRIQSSLGLESEIAEQRAQRQARRELATASIAYTTSEGHHSLIEGIAPMQDALGLKLDTETPEDVLLNQVMPDRLRGVFSENLDEWVNEQFVGDNQLLGEAVKARIRRFLPEGGKQSKTRKTKKPKK